MLPTAHTTATLTGHQPKLGLDHILPVQKSRGFLPLIKDHGAAMPGEGPDSSVARLPPEAG